MSKMEKAWLEDKKREGEVWYSRLRFGNSKGKRTNSANEQKGLENFKLGNGALGVERPHKRKRRDL